MDGREELEETLAGETTGLAEAETEMTEDGGRGREQRHRRAETVAGAGAGLAEALAVRHSTLARSAIVWATDVLKGKEHVWLVKVNDISTV